MWAAPRAPTILRAQKGRKSREYCRDVDPLISSRFGLPIAISPLLMSISLHPPCVSVPVPTTLVFIFSVYRWSSRYAIPAPEARLAGRET